MYKAFVTRIKTRPHTDPEVENIQIGVCTGAQVVVGKDTQDGELVVFFPSDGQLDKDFALHHKLFRKHPDTDAQMGGYLEKNARIRQIKLRGEKSEGIVIPVRKFDYIKGGVEFLQKLEGEGFDGKICGVQVAQKYVTPATRRAMERSKNKTKKRKEKEMIFPKHGDTAHLKWCKNQLNKGDVCYLTEKLHGTSQRVARTYVTQPLNSMQKLLNKIGFKFKPKVNIEVVTGSRNVVIDSEEGGFYGNNKFRLDITDSFKDYLLPGEIVYGEIVGWINENKPIMPPHDIKKLRDKELEKRYGKTNNYHYGCKQGECKFYVYRICRVDQNGHETELSWSHVKRRAEELGLDTTPDLCYPVVITEEFGAEQLTELVSSLEDGPSLLDPTQMREGVCVRVEGHRGMNIYKSKSFNFGVMEGYLKQKDDYVDEEESA